MGFSVSTSSGGKRQDPQPEINVTPLVDVVLVLLIIFMVIAPAITEGERIDLPAIFTPDPETKDLTPIEVIIAAHGAMLVNKERIKPAELKPKLVRLHRIDENRHLMLKTDENVPYKKVRETFAVVQDIGFKGVALKVIERKSKGG
jgi:biopolymer transport protein ExbD/biopolymer transport protein TolR